MHHCHMPSFKTCWHLLRLLPSDYKFKLFRMILPINRSTTESFLVVSKQQQGKLFLFHNPKRKASQFVPKVDASTKLTFFLNKMGQVLSTPTIPMEEPPSLKFTLFPKLPPELRNKIWEFALPGMCPSAVGKTQFLFRSVQNNLYGAIANSVFMKVHERSRSRHGIVLSSTSSSNIVIDNNKTNPISLSLSMSAVILAR